MSEVSSNAMNGFIICNLLMAAQSTAYQYTTSVNRLDSFKMGLDGFDEISGFHRIDVTLVDYMNNELPDPGYINGIRLIFEDGISLQLYISTSSRIV